jgi:hypothetical protein
MKLRHFTQLALLGALLLCTLTTAGAQPEPFMISGYVTYENGTPCNGPSVTITNLDTSGEWQAENSSNSHYYQLVLASGMDVNATEQLQFQVSQKDSEQARLVVYTVSSSDVTRGGLLPYNLSLTVPGRQTWYFTTNDASPPLSALAIYNKTMTKGAESGDEIVTLAPGECVWFYADQLANGTVPFPPGTWDVRYWVKALNETESDTVLYTRLQNLTSGSLNTTIAENESLICYSEGALQEIDLALAAGSFSVPKGGRFAIELWWPASATGDLEIYCNPPEQLASSVTSPSSDPGYPVPELPSVLLLGLGLLVLLGLYGLRGKRRLGQ